MKRSTEAHVRRRRARAARRCPCAACPTIHSSASSIPRQASSRTSRPLYGRSRPKNSTTGLLGSRSGGGAAGRVGEVREGAVGDHVHAPGVDAELVDQPLAAVLRSARRSRRSARTGAAARARWPGRGSRGSTSCAVSTSGRSSRAAGAPSSCCTVSHWKCTTSAAVASAAVAEHVGHVLGELDQPARARVRHGPRGAVEELAPGVALGRRDGAVGEAARDELDVGARAASARQSAWS